MSHMAAEECLTHFPSTVDPVPIRDQLDSVAPPYDVEHWLIPLPVWATRPFDHDPDTAWRILQEDLETSSRSGPFCVYLHVPFCSSKCHFCDCYSFALSVDNSARMDQYADAVCDELATWRAKE